MKELAFGFGLKTKTGALGLILDVEAVGTFEGVDEATVVAVVGGLAGAMTGVEPAEAGTLGRNGGISAIRAAVGDERVEAALATGVACEWGVSARAGARMGDWTGLVAVDADGFLVLSRPIEAMSSGMGVLSCARKIQSVISSLRYFEEIRQMKNRNAP